MRFWWRGWRKCWYPACLPRRFIPVICRPVICIPRSWVRPCSGPLAGQLRAQISLNYPQHQHRKTAKTPSLIVIRSTREAQRDYIRLPPPGNRRSNKCTPNQNTLTRQKLPKCIDPEKTSSKCPIRMFFPYRPRKSSQVWLSLKIWKLRSNITV